MRKYDTSEKLLEIFDSVIQSKLTPFMTQKGMSHSVGSSDFQTPVSNLQKREYLEMSNKFFWWVNRFQNDRFIIDISYGEREFVVQTRIFYHGAKEWFGAWELLSASSTKEVHAASGEQWVLNCDFMERTIEQLANGIQNNWEALSSCDKNIIATALKLREERSRASKAEGERQDMERCCMQASAAFHSKKYYEAIKLLEPYENNPMLPKTSAKLLAMAKKYDE